MNLKRLFTQFLDRVDDFLDDTRESLTETTRLTLDTLRRVELHRFSDTARRRLRSRPLRYLSHPYFNFAMGAVLFLALSIAGIAADNARAIWTLWIPLPLLGVIALSGWPDFRVVRRGMLLGAVSLLVLIMIRTRLRLGMSGPIPHLAVREVVDLFLAFLAGIAVWITAGRQTIGVYASWLSALGIVLVSRIELSETPLLFRPDALPIVLSLLWGFAALGGAVSHRFDPPSLRPLSGSPCVPAHALAAVFGAALGWICVRFYLTTPEATARDMAGAIQRGHEAANLLWAKSLLFGWGRDVSLRLSAVITEPMSIEIPQWQGISGTLASHGLASLVAGILVSLVLMWHAGRRARVYGLSLSSAPQLALLAAQTMIWLILVGSPHSAVPWMLLGGWIGLGLASGSYAKFQLDPQTTFEDEEAYSQLGLAFRLGVVGMVELAVLLGCALAFRPVYAAHVVDGVTPDDLREPSLQTALNRARTLAPWDPSVEMTEGMRLREHLQTRSAHNWDERLFQATCRAYERAHRLDPFDPLIVLQHAKLLDLADRPEDAQRAVLAALDKTPSSELLVEWLYLQSNRRRNHETALLMIKRGIRLHPRESKWWLRLYSTESLAGRGPIASIALGTALTAEPGNKLLVQAAHQRDTERIR